MRGLNRPHLERDPDAEALSSPQEHLHAFLRSLDAEAEGLPDRFVAHLERALGHFGVTGLERTAALEDAAYRLFLAQQRAPSARDAVRALLARRLEQAEPLEGEAADAFRGVLDRLEAALAPREPALAELARELRWRCCDRPAVEAAREETYALMRVHLAALADRPDRADRDAHLQALVDCPQPLARLLTQGTDDFLLEAMTRRYYRIRELERARAPGDRRRGVPAHVLRARRDPAPRRRRASPSPTACPRRSRALASHARTLPEGEPLLGDLYGATAPPDRDALVAGAALPPAVARLAFVSPAERRGHAVDVTTFTRGEDGALAEDRDLRGLHPLMAQRMDLWRLENFALERLPSAPDVYLFHARARDNERDERLVAVAEVRDLTPGRDDAGRIVALPDLERIARQAFEAMRAAQSRRSARSRLQWNRLLLYAWPEIEFSPDEAREVITRLGRMSAGLGLEMVQLRIG